MHRYIYIKLHPITYPSKAITEPFEDFLHVTTLLHGDDTEMILLIDPYKESLAVIVP